MSNRYYFLITFVSLGSFRVSVVITQQYFCHKSIFVFFAMEIFRNSTLLINQHSIISLK